MKLIERTFAPALLGRDAAEVERIWRDLMFMTHATTVGAITAIAQAAIDTALWDLRCRKAGLPLHVMAGGAQPSVPLYTTEGGWLHLEPQALVDDALRAKEEGFGGVEDQDRPAARVRGHRAPVRGARRHRPGDGDHDGRQPGLHRGRGDPPRPAIRTARHRVVRGAVAGRRPRRPCAAGAQHRGADRGRRKHLQPAAFPRIPRGRRVLDRAGGCRPHRRHHALAEGRASGRDVQRAGLPAFPDGAACRAMLRGAECALGRIHPAAGRRSRPRGCASRTAAPCPRPSRASASNGTGRRSTKMADATLGFTL